MSTLTVAAIESTTANTPPVIKDSLGDNFWTFCRAWVNFNGTGTVAIRAAFNVIGITDSGTGLFDVNFTSPMPDTNYAACFTAQNGSRGVCCNIAASTASDTPTLKSINGVRMSIRVEGTGALVDCNEISASIFS
jgi:hypothetical protein